MPTIFPSFFLTADAVQINTPKLMGRQSAGNGFLRAVVQAYSHVDAPLKMVHRGGDQVQALDAELRSMGWQGETAHALDSKPSQWLDGGVLYYPAPFNSKLAWQRARYGGHSVALCGVTHTISSHGVLSQFADYVHGAFHPWDALICTSQSVHKTVHQVWDEQRSQLASRLKVAAVKPDMPMTPVVPLGIHAADFEPSDSKRCEARESLGIANSEIILLFVGRLSLHAKANPWPMYKAAAKSSASMGCKLRILECGWFANDAIQASFDEAAQLAGVEILRVDGRVPGMSQKAYAAADIFVSLSDNIQETFGLTPVEAMAAGLPVVASDWDGYRETIRDGVDGFLIPTAQPLDMACMDAVSASYEDGVQNYDLYIAHAHTIASVDIEACARALGTLIGDPGLRRKMGAAGRQRVLESFEWSVVMRLYQDVWHEQEALRLHASAHDKVPVRRNPGFLNPLSLFDHYPSNHVLGETVVRVADGIVQQDVKDIRRLRMWGFAHAWLTSADGMALAWVKLSEQGKKGLSIRDWARRSAWSEPYALIQASWMLKMGLLKMDGGTDS